MKKIIVILVLILIPVFGYCEQVQTVDKNEDGKIDNWFFIRKVGKHNQERMVDALNFIKSGKLDLDSSLKLVTNWVKMLNYLITNF